MSLYTMCSNAHSIENFLLPFPAYLFLYVANGCILKSDRQMELQGSAWSAWRMTGRTFERDKVFSTAAIKEGNSTCASNHSS